MTEEIMNTNEEMETYTDENQVAESNDNPTADLYVECIGTECYEEPESNSGKIALAVIGGAVALGGILIAKNKQRIETWRDNRALKRLQKKGYVVSAAVDDADEKESIDVDPENIHVVVED